MKKITTLLVFLLGSLFLCAQSNKVFAQNIKDLAGDWYHSFDSMRGPCKIIMRISVSADNDILVRRKSLSASTSEVLHYFENDKVISVDDCSFEFEDGGERYKYREGYEWDYYVAHRIYKFELNDMKSANLTLIGQKNISYKDNCIVDIEYLDRDQAHRVTDIYYRDDGW